MLLSYSKYVICIIIKCVCVYTCVTLYIHICRIDICISDYKKILYIGIIFKCFCLKYRNRFYRFLSSPYARPKSGLRQIRYNEKQLYVQNFWEYSNIFNIKVCVVIWQTAILVDFISHSISVFLFGLFTFASFSFALFLFPLCLCQSSFKFSKFRYDLIKVIVDDDG